jgi:hypothetical protein
MQVKSVLAVAGLFVASAISGVALDPSTASATDCSGTVQVVRIANNGTLEIRFSGQTNYANVCNINDPSYYSSGINGETCKEWFSMALAARLSGKKIKLYDAKDNSSPANDASCTGGYLIPSRVALYD